MESLERNEKSRNYNVEDFTGVKGILLIFSFRTQLLGFFKKETKTKAFDNQKLRKALQNADELLDNICDQITDDYKAKDDIINSLMREAKEKDTLVKICECFSPFNSGICGIMAIDLGCEFRDRGSTPSMCQFADTDLGKLANKKKKKKQSNGGFLLD